MKRLLLATIILLLWASPAMGETFTLDYSFPELDELSGIEYEIGQIKNEPAHNNKWDKWDTTLLVLRIIDWGQTREIAANYTVDKTVQYWDKNTNQWEYYKKYKYKEYNPILGEHPTITEVNRYFTITIGLDILIVNYANPRFHKYWRNIGLILESYCVGRNISYGIDIRF